MAEVAEYPIQLHTQVNGYGQPGNPVASFVRAAKRALADQDGP